MPGMPKAKVRSRVIMTPQHAKRLLKALAGNVKRYEDKHGAIPPAVRNAILIKFLLKNKLVKINLVNIIILITINQKIICIIL